MDTDDLSDKAYDLIVQAARVSDTLKAELGAMSARSRNEKEWLNNVGSCLRKIAADPQDYVDYWNLEEAEGVTPAMIKDCAVRCFNLPEA